jgi:thiamine biosynthesis lipoprotein
VSEAVTVRTEVLMGTLVTIRVVASGAEALVERAFEWFDEIEQRCTRFDVQSELMQLTAHVGEPVPASPILFEAVQFALKVAEETGGAFDPAIGHRMEARKFNREYKTGQVVESGIAADAGVSHRDVRLDTEHRTITLLRPLVLDLGAVAKGLAVDAAAQELRPFINFSVEAGGDVYLGGCNAKGTPWSVGIRHPRIAGELIDSLHVTNKAVCTSGDYERRSAAESDGHHILDPRTGTSPHAVASATVIAPTAMLADALATAALVLGPEEGIRLLERHGVGGLIFTPELERFETEGLARG